jgi:hypothetical protein
MDRETIGTLKYGWMATLMNEASREHSPFCIREQAISHRRQPLQSLVLKKRIFDFIDPLHHCSGITSSHLLMYPEA